MGKKVGFTGTSKGASKEQLAEVEKVLAKLLTEGFDEFHHGLCIGADEQAARIAKRLGYRVVAHPGLAHDPKNLLFRSEFALNDEVRDAKPFLKRDQEIVNDTERLIATPLTRGEQTRSGTWTTVRYAKKVGRLTDLILPPFVAPKWTAPPPPRTNAIAGEDPMKPACMKRGLR